MSEESVAYDPDDPEGQEPVRAVWHADQVFNTSGFTFGLKYDDHCWVYLLPIEPEGWRAIAWIPPEVAEEIVALAAARTAKASE